MIVGAGFAGLKLATRPSDSLGYAVRVALIDRNDSFHFGFSKLDVLLGRHASERRTPVPSGEIAKEGVEFHQETVTAYRPIRRRVSTGEGRYDADFLAIALGAKYDPSRHARVPGGRGSTTHSLAGAERLGEILAGFEAGKILISVLGHPLKWPPVPLEGPFLLHDLFAKRGIRDAVDLRMTFPMAAPVPVTEQVSQLFRAPGLDERDIHYAGRELVVGLDSRQRTARLAERRDSCPTTSSSESRSTAPRTWSAARRSRLTAGSPSIRRTWPRASLASAHWAMSPPGPAP